MIVLDTSAILAILLEEPERDLFRETISRAGVALVSAGTAVELAATAGRSERLRADVPAFLHQPFVKVEPVTATQAAAAVDAFRAFGKGHHPAALNFGDMFAYLLARERGLPLLFKGNDFAQTDVRSALAGDSPSA